MEANKGMSEKRKVTGVLLALFGGTLWGFSGVWGQFLFQRKGINADWLSTWRLFLSGMIILILLVPRYKKDIFNFVSINNLITAVIFSLVSVLCCQYSYFAAVEASNSATATVLQYISPAIVMIVSCVKTKNMPSATQLIALGCAMLGVFIMATGGKFGELDMSKNALFWGLLSAIGYASYTLQSAGLSEKYGLFVILGWGNLIASLPLLIVCHNNAFVFYSDIQIVIGLIGITLCGSVISFASFVKGCSLAGTVTGSLCACVEPLSSAVFAYMWLGTSFKITDVIGLVLIIATVMILALSGKKYN